MTDGIFLNTTASIVDMRNVKSDTKNKHNYLSKIVIWSYFSIPTSFPPEEHFLCTHVFSMYSLIFIVMVLISASLNYCTSKENVHENTKEINYPLI